MRREDMWWSFRFVSPFGIAAAGYAIATAPPVDPEAVQFDLSVWFLLHDVAPGAVFYGLFCLALFVVSTRNLRQLGKPPS